MSADEALAVYGVVLAYLTRERPRRRFPLTPERRARLESVVRKMEAAAGEDEDG